ncbi:MAG: TlpA disulfide reductase family protein [bacterium]
MRNLKIFSLIIIFSFIMVNNTACTKETKNDKTETVQDNKHDVQIAANSEKGPQILDITNVGVSQKGKAVDFEWMENGKKYTFSGFTKNKVVFLNFWATWCGPCRMEIPDIIELNKELPDKDFVVISVALDNRGTLEQIRSLVQGFAKQMKINYHIFLPTKDVVTPYGDISGIPTTFIIDRKGNIVEKIVGGRNKAQFLQSIKRAMNS